MVINVKYIFILFSFFSCLSKTGVGVLEMDPLHASWVTEACCCLHNLCKDWGVTEIMDGENKDPDLEELIQEEASLRIARSMQRAAQSIREGNVPDQGTMRQNTRGARYAAGFHKRARYIHKHYGGPRPERQPRGRRR